MLAVNAKIAIPDEEFAISFARSSGPGGQNVNKTNSKAVLDWDVVNSPSLPLDVKARFLKTFASKLTTEGHIVIASDESRAQEANVKGCFEKLKTMLLAVATPPKIRRPTKPTKSSQRARVDNKKTRSKTKKNRQKVDY
jgi:ribosome-associated protein